MLGAIPTTQTLCRGTMLYSGVCACNYTTTLVARAQSQSDARLSLVWAGKEVLT